MNLNVILLETPWQWFNVSRDHVIRIYNYIVFSLFNREGKKMVNYEILIIP